MYQRIRYRFTPVRCCRICGTWNRSTEAEDLACILPWLLLRIPVMKRGHGAMPGNLSMGPTSRSRSVVQNYHTPGTRYQVQSRYSRGPILVWSTIVRGPILGRRKSLVTSSSHLSAVPALRCDRSLLSYSGTVTPPHHYNCSTHRRSSVTVQRTHRQGCSAQLAVYRPYV